MSFAVFLLLLFALYIALRYIHAHENLVRQVQVLTVQKQAAPEAPAPFDLKETLVGGLQTLRGLIPQ